MFSFFNNLFSYPLIILFISFFSPFCLFLFLYCAQWEKNQTTDMSTHHKYSDGTLGTCDDGVWVPKRRQVAGLGGDTSRSYSGMFFLLDLKSFSIDKLHLQNGNLRVNANDSRQGPEIHHHTFSSFFGVLIFFQVYIIYILLIIIYV